MPYTFACVSMDTPLLPSRRRGRRRLSVCGVPLESPRHRELTQLVTHHVLGDEYGDVLLAVVDGNREADEVGDHRGPARPRLDRLLVVGGARGIHLLQQVVIDERAFLQ